MSDYEVPEKPEPTPEEYEAWLSEQADKKSKGLVILVVCNNRIWDYHYKRLSHKSLDRYKHVHDQGVPSQVYGEMPDKIIIHSTNVNDKVMEAIIDRGNKFNAGIYNEYYT